MPICPHFRRVLLAAVAALSAPGAGAEPVPDAVRRFAEVHTRGLGERVTIEVLSVTARLGECAAPEVFLPAGSRLWGRSHVGVRCAAPSAWLVYVPIYVKVSGRYLTSTKKLSVGQTLTDTDFATIEGELSAQAEGVLTDPEQARGQKLRTAVAAGLPLRRDHLQRLPVVRQGQPVRIVVRGAGFTVSSEGVALANGFEGETVRVRNPSGRTVQGKAMAGGVVELPP